MQSVHPHQDPRPKLAFSGRWFVLDGPAPTEKDTNAGEAQPEVNENEQSLELADKEEPSDLDSTTKKEGPSTSESLAALKSAEVIDPETHAKITTREDLCVQVHYSTGEKIIEYPDRTRVTITTEGWKLETAGFPTVIGGDFGVSVAPVPGEIRPSLMPPLATYFPSIPSERVCMFVGFIYLVT